MKRFLSRFLMVGLLLAAGVWIRIGPLPRGFLDEPAMRSTTVVDRHGVILYEARGSGGTRSETLSADALPPVLIDATLAAEDHRFFRHPGVDPLALVRAAWRNLAEGRVVEGGSTITQQVVKLLRARRAQAEGAPSRPRGLSDKLYEMLLATRLEHRLSKREILALYVSVAPYGNQIAGAERASRAYFGVAASMLTPAQAAFLAALPQQPSRFNPWQRPDRAARRARRVLERMRALGLLDARGADEALAERIVLRPDTVAFGAPHFVERVLAAAGAARPERIETTIDAELQAEVAGIIRSRRRDLDRHGAHNVAVVVLDNARGEWLAWEGSGDYLDAAHGGTIDGASTPRQPGSALKPFTYALAFDEGYGPASVLPDVPSHFPTAEPGVVYSPRNYDGRFRGPLRARLALAGSENVPAVALLSELGPPALVRFLRRAGFTTFDKTVAHYGLGVTLGNAEVRLDELAAAYAALSRGGVWIRASAVRRDERPRGTRLVTERAAFWITDILSDADAREYVFGRGGSLEFPFPVAAKTGTSQGYRDNWAIGYTRDVTVGVWVGNFDRAPLRNSSGVTGAGPIFHAAMLAAMRRFGRAADAPETGPAGVVKQTVCALSGMLANAWCPSKTPEWMPAESEALPCSWHHQTDEGLLVVWPPRYRAWAADRGLVADAAYAGPKRPGAPRPGAPRPGAPRPGAPFLAIGPGAPPSTVPGARGLLGPASPGLLGPASPGLSGPAPPALQIISPPEGAIYLIDPTLRREFQTLPLRAATAGGGTIEWRIDGKPAGRAGSDAAVMWPLAPGQHVIAARDAKGRTAEASILVK